MEHSYMPFDIQAQIIQRLPIKALIRFKLVSKPWNSLIRSSKFIGEYNDREDYSEDRYVSIIDDDTFPEHKFFLKELRDKNYSVALKDYFVSIIRIILSSFFGTILL